MKKMKKTLALLLALAMTVVVFAACGGDKTPEPAPTPDPAPATSGEPAPEGGAEGGLPYEGVTLKLVVTDTQAEGAETKKLVELVRERTGVELDLTIIPTAAEGEVDKRLVSLQAGDSLDILYGTTAQLKTFYNAGVLMPLDDLAAAAGYDFEAVFTDGSLPTFDDGKTYGFPAFSDIWLTFINTKWFNEADIEIPSAEGWTWDKYVETAQAITDAGMVTESGAPVWGSFMETYNNYNYMVATQKGADAYKADGTANFDDPVFSDAMAFYNDLGKDLKIQPDKKNMLAGTYAWNQFVASDDMAMFVCGGWVASMLSNSEQYPRDWEVAIRPMPYPAGSSPSTLSIPGCYAVPATSSNPEAAFEVVKVIAEEMYTLGEGRIPARKDLTQDEINDYVVNQLLPTTFVNDPSVTAEDISTAWFDPNRALLPEKIIGTADGTINRIFKEEGDLYGIGAQDLETTMENIQNMANKAIEEEKNA